MNRPLYAALALLIALALGLSLFKLRSRNQPVVESGLSIERSPVSNMGTEPENNDSESTPGVIKISSGVVLELAELSEKRIKEIQAISQFGKKDVSEIPEFELPPKEVRTVQEAFVRIKFISMVEYPRFYFFDGEYWYFSGGRRAVRADDFSDGYRVSKTGYITMWYERK